MAIADPFSRPYIKGGRENGYPPFLTRNTLNKKL
jgi:hypothetical protein